MGLIDLSAEMVTLITLLYIVTQPGFLQVLGEDHFTDVLSKRQTITFENMVWNGIVFMVLVTLVIILQKNNTFPQIALVVVITTALYVALSPMGLQFPGFRVTEVTDKTKRSCGSGWWPYDKKNCCAINCKMNTPLRILFQGLLYGVLLFVISTGPIKLIRGY
tara:strand:- start:259 stop:747 length:489 start_codon:yes stop_codon:yes gene_type:complete